MQVTKVGNIYKVAHITGPQHNFLGLAFSDVEVPSITVERLQVGDEVVPGSALDEQQLIAAVRRGIAEANQQFGTHFYVAILQYVVTDTPDMSTYMLLAQKIVEAAWRDTSQVASAVSPGRCFRAARGFRFWDIWGIEKWHTVGQRYSRGSHEILPTWESATRGRPVHSTSMVIPVVLEQHAEAAAFHGLLRDVAVCAPPYSLDDLAKLDNRLDAYIDGVRIAGEAGWEICQEQLRWKKRGEAFSQPS